MRELIEMASNQGFPMVMCLILAYYVKYMTDNLVRVINALTISVESLKEKFDIDGGEIE